MLSGSITTLASPQGFLRQPIQMRPYDTTRFLAIRETFDHFDEVR